jgi:GTP-binding protein
VIHTIVDATFLTSAASLHGLPPKDKSEIAFLGRSNVGKSSLINALAQRKGLAKSSSTPGKTKLINFFDMTIGFRCEHYSLRIIDLPGFGYAKVSRETRQWWDDDISAFLASRDSIKLFLHLVDSRHTNMENDHQIRAFIEPLLRGDQRIVTVFTKYDKLKQNDKVRLKQAYPESIRVSILKKTNIHLIHNEIMEHLFGIFDVTP